MDMVKGGYDSRLQIFERLSFRRGHSSILYDFKGVESISVSYLSGHK